MTSPRAAFLQSAFSGKRVLLTGHTGFKGSWLTLWLWRLGARVSGFALAPDTTPSAFDLLQLASRCERHVLGDVRDAAALRRVVRESLPEFVFHLAAQSLVRRSRAEPVTTFDTNVMGTLHVLEALRAEGSRATVVIVTSDKCYENREDGREHREEDPLGGDDLYSASKAATEILVASYRTNFFAPERLAEHGLALCSARAGNVIGGGDWALDRIVPDCVRALARGEPIVVRNPGSIRPWQHVLEPLSGYLTLAAHAARGEPAERARFCEAWNFGPTASSTRPVRELVEALVARWGEGRWETRPEPDAPLESKVLRLSIDKAVRRLGWRPRFTFEQALVCTVAWYAAARRGTPPAELCELSERQIQEYLEADDEIPAD